MKTNLVLAAVVVASLVGSVAQADGIARGIDARSRRGYSEFLRLKYGNMETMTAEQIAKAQHEQIERRGEAAGRDAIAKAGIHAPRITDADVMRRAKSAAKTEKLADSEVETFISGFVSVFTSARMNAR